MNRRTFVKTSGLALGAMGTLPAFGKSKTADQHNFPLVDLHVHLAERFTIEHVMDISKKTGIQFGIVEHPAEFAIKDDSDLKKYIDSLRQYPVYIGLQPIDLGWSKNFSPEVLAQLDYVLMDAQRVPMGDGERLSI